MSEEYGLILPSQMKYVPKPWGWELWIANNELYCGKKLFIKQGHWLSFHHHEQKDEVLFLESGDVLFSYGDDEKTLSTINLKPGFAFRVRQQLKHQIIARQDSLIYEFSTQHFDEDSYRTTRDLVGMSEDHLWNST